MFESGRTRLIVFSLVAAWMCWWRSAGAAESPADQPHYFFSRLILEDTRGRDGRQTILVIDQREARVNLWLKDSLGKRMGDFPAEEHARIFEKLKSIPVFGQKSHYLGKPQRRYAARGTITLAWQGKAGREVKTIQYSAPERALDDFRTVFNQLWASSRYAILSPTSFESSLLDQREDALYFLSGFGWMTQKEVDGVLAFYLGQGSGPRLARAVWSTLDQDFIPGSDYADRRYLEYCVSKGMQRLGKPARDYLADHLAEMPAHRRLLADRILRTFSH